MYKSSNNTEFHLVYGNHGSSLCGIEDFLVAFLEAFNGMGKKLKFSREPVPGSTNILIECFDQAYVARLQAMKRQPGTRFILVATEFITGDTFNNFNFNKSLSEHFVDDAVSSLRSALRGTLHTLPHLTPKVVRDLLLKISPATYLKLKKVHHNTHPLPVVDFKNYRRYWKQRYLCFKELAEIAHSLWCVSPSQVELYKQAFPDQKVHYFPLCSWNSAPKLQMNDANKDIDFLFTGALTPYRRDLLDALEARGHKIVTSPATWPDVLRQQALMRTKICLHIPQSADWRFSSVMRYHHMLTHGCLLVAERALESCEQESCVYAVSHEEFLAACEHHLELSDFAERGRRLSIAYYEESASARELARRVVNSLDDDPLTAGSRFDLLPHASPANI